MTVTKKPTPLDDINDALARIAKALPGATGDGRTSRKLTLDEFITHVRAEVAQIHKDEPVVARQRVAMLERSIKSVQAQVAKLSFADLGGGGVKVDVETAFAPLGEPPIEGLTTAADQSSTEISPVSAGGTASTSATFAENLAEVAKALEQLSSKLSARPAGEKPAAASEKPAAAAPGATAKAVGWPLDLNTSSFRDAVSKDEDAPAWGFDPDDGPSAEDDPP